MYFMFKDITLIDFDLSSNRLVVLNQDLLPYSLRRRLVNTESDIGIIINNILYFKDYLSSRVLSLSRENAKQIYTMFGIPQRNDTATRVKICLLCKGVSIQDSFWVRTGNERWEDVNIRQNRLSDIVDVALYGKPPSVTTNRICPELSTKGLFRKAWVREKDGLYLLKSDRTSNNINTRMEVLASQILDCTNIPHTNYTGRVRNTEIGKIYVDKSKCYVDEGHYAVDAWELQEFFGEDFGSVMLNMFGSRFANIPVIDYILANTDRHTENYGCYVDDRGILTDIIPLYDFNLALVSDVLGTDVSNTYSQMFGKLETLEECMRRYIAYSDIKVDTNKLNALYKRTKYKYVLDRVIERLQYIGII